MTTPSDAGVVVPAIRLGWYVAEVRGRNDPEGPTRAVEAKPAPAAAAAGGADREPNTLPLRPERSEEERRIAAQAAVAALADKLGVDALDAADVVGDVKTYGALIDQQAKALQQALDGGHDAAGPWATLASTLFHFDAHVQDQLGATADIQACAYLLGRGMAETYWAFSDLHRSDLKDSPHWAALFTKRTPELSRLIGRLGAYLGPYSAPALDGSVHVWAAVAADENWRGQHDTPAVLYDQIRRWYEIMILGQDPTTLLRPYALIRSFRTTLKLLRVFWPQILLTAVSIGLLIGVVAAIASGSGTAVGKTIFGALSVLGLSAASVTTKLKSATTSLVQRLQQDAYADLIATAVTVAPAVTTKGLGQKRQAQRKIADEVGNRRITSGTGEASLAA